MVSEPRKQSMAWRETNCSKYTHFRWKIKWRLEHSSALGITGETAQFSASRGQEHQNAPSRVEFEILYGRWIDTKLYKNHKCQTRGGEGGGRGEEEEKEEEKSKYTSTLGTRKSKCNANTTADTQLANITYRKTDWKHKRHHKKSTDTDCKCDRARTRLSDKTHSSEYE